MTTDIATKESVSDLFVAGCYGDLLDMMAGQDQRQAFMEKTSALFGVPRSKTNTDQAVSFFLKACRLRYDTVAEAAHRQHLLKGLTEALSFKENAPDKPAPVATSAPSAEVTSAPVRTFSGNIPDLPLYKQDDAAALPDTLPADYLAMLGPAPIRGATMQAISKWVTGRPLDEKGLAIGFPNLSEDALNELMDIEGTVTATPSVYTRDPADVDWHPSAQKAAEAMSRMGEQIEGKLPAADDHVVLRLYRAAISEVIDTVFPEKGKAYRAYGATLRTGTELMDALRVALRVEEAWLGADGPFHGEKQILVGTTQPTCEISSGHIFRRMAYNHLACGFAPIAALQEAVVDTRFAMLMRKEIGDPSFAFDAQNFESRLQSDCLSPLTDYTIARTQQNSMEVP